MDKNKYSRDMKKQINDLLLKMQIGENCIGETANKLLDLYNVSQQRELLIAYHKHNTMIRNEELDKFIENYVDDYLSNL